MIIIPIPLAVFLGAFTVLPTTIMVMRRIIGSGSRVYGYHEEDDGREDAEDLHVY
jgi:hypothetical protein